MDMIGGAKILSDRFERRLNHDTARQIEADAEVTPRERVGSLDAPVKVGGAPLAVGDETFNAEGGSAGTYRDRPAASLCTRCGKWPAVAASCNTWPSPVCSGCSRLPAADPGDPTDVEAWGEVDH